MWLMTRLAIVFYVTIIWITSLCVILFVFHVLELNTVEQILRIILLVVSIASFTAATILYKKKIKKIEENIKEEIK